MQGFQDDLRQILDLPDQTYRDSSLPPSDRDGEVFLGSPRAALALSDAICGLLVERTNSAAILPCLVKFRIDELFLLACVSVHIPSQMHCILYPPVNHCSIMT